MSETAQQADLVPHATRATPTVSVIATVLNEGAAIDELLDTLAAQTCQPDEVVIVDGGSTDDTLARLRRAEGQSRLKVRVLEMPGANISAGRNAAVRAASGSLIAATDVGVRLAPCWLERLVEPFTHPEAPDVVSGFFVPDARSTFEVALAATTLPALRDIRPERFLPSSRSVAFRKAAWEAVGGYPEWLDYCEDLIFDLRLQASGCRFAFAPEAVVAFRPRPNLPAFFRQYYRYARGDGKADLWRRRHCARYVTYCLLAPLTLALCFLVSLWWALLFLAGSAAMFATPYRRLPHLWNSLSWRQKLAAIAWVPIIRLTGDVAKMLGYPVGLAWRLAHRGQPELHWRTTGGLQHEGTKAPRHKAV